MADRAITLAFETGEVKQFDAESWVSERVLTLTFGDDPLSSGEAAADPTGVLSCLPAYMMAANRSPSAEWVNNAR
jgi:hypothetical protein